MRLSFFELDQLSQNEMLVLYAETTDPQERKRLENYILKREAKLVYWLTNKHFKKKSSFSSGITWDELLVAVQEGFLSGLRKFDPSKGFKLNTFINYSVHGKVTTMYRDENLTIRIPANLLDKIHAKDESKRPSDSKMALVNDAKYSMSLNSEDEWFQTPINATKSPEDQIANSELMKDILEFVKSVDCMTYKAIFTPKNRSLALELNVHPEKCKGCRGIEPNSYQVKKLRKEFEERLAAEGFSKDLFKGILG